MPRKDCLFSFRGLEGRSFQLNMTAPESAATLELIYKELVYAKHREGLYRLTDIQKWGLQAGDVFIDAGANLGFVSILAAMAWPSAHVYGFEANPLTHAFLAENVWRNGVKNRVQANNLGLSGDGRDLQFSACSKINIGRNGIYEKHLRPFSSKDRCGAHNSTRVVPSATLQSILQSVVSPRSPCSSWTARAASSRCSLSYRCLRAVSWIVASSESWWVSAT